VLLHNGGFGKAAAQKEFYSYMLSLHEKTDFVQNMTKNMIFFFSLSLLS
jgi:hypothetical protein